MVETEPETGSKEVRAGPFASKAEAGNVRVKRAEWSAKLIGEFVDFPSGKNDDQVDAGSNAFNRLVIWINGTSTLVVPGRDPLTAMEREY